MELNDEFVSLETAKLLKLKGFDVPIHTACHQVFKDKDEVSIWYGDRKENFNDLPEEENSQKFYSCPTQQMAMRWLREKHKIHINVRYLDFLEHGEVWDATVVIMSNFNEQVIENTENTYEQALEFALQYVLKNLI